jgi:hypothetical protein
MLRGDKNFPALRSQDVPAVLFGEIRPREGNLLGSEGGEG